MLESGDRAAEDYTGINPEGPNRCGVPGRHDRRVRLSQQPGELKAGCSLLDLHKAVDMSIGHWGSIVSAEDSTACLPKSQAAPFSQNGQY